MSSVVKYLFDKNLINPPGFLVGSTHYETMMGSIAYGVDNNSSDVDVYGFCIPSKDVVFPHLAGHIHGFGKQRQEFGQYQQHHVKVPGSHKEYDLSIYNIVKFFQLCMENNPNMVDSLFTPRRCVLHCTAVGELVRTNRKIFLHKGCWPKFKGYAYSSLNKVSKDGKNKDLIAIRAFEDLHGIHHTVTLEMVRREVEKRSEGSEYLSLTNLPDVDLNLYLSMYEKGMSKSKRFESRKIHKMDVKYLYHVVRLMYEVEMILVEGDLDLERNREHLKAVRRGEVSEVEIRDWASAKEKSLEKAYSESKLQWGPDQKKIKSLLLNCLEHHYGSLSGTIAPKDIMVDSLRVIRDEIDKIRSIINT